MDQIEIAKGISDFGMLAVAAAFFLVFSAAMLMIFVKFFVRIINEIMTDQKNTLSELLGVTKEQNNWLSDISEGLRDETLMQIKILSGLAFDLNKLDVQHMLKKIRNENNISNREEVQYKIRKLLQVLHENRNSKFDNFKFRGRRVSCFTSQSWIEKIAGVVEGELYHKSGSNNGRAYSNISACFEDIKIEFYHNLMRS